MVKPLRKTPGVLVQGSMKQHEPGNSNGKDLFRAPAIRDLPRHLPKVSVVKVSQRKRILKRLRENIEGSCGLGKIRQVFDRLYL